MEKQRGTMQSGSGCCMSAHYCRQRADAQRWSIIITSASPLRLSSASSSLAAVQCQNPHLTPSSVSCTLMLLPVAAANVAPQTGPECLRNNASFAIPPACYPYQQQFQ